MTTYTYPIKGVWRLRLTGPEALLNAVGAAEVTIEGLYSDDPLDRSNLEYQANDDLAQQMGYDSYDDMPEQYCPPDWSDPELTHNEWVTPDGKQQWFVAVYLADQGYGGPEEGGWWYECGELVQQTAVNSREEAEELRERLREQFPDTGKRYSVLSGDDYSIRIDIRPMEAGYPETRPRYE